MAVQFWMNGMVFASFIPRLPEIRTRLGVDLDRLGLLLTLGSLGGLAASASCGRLIERFGTRTVMTAGSLGMILVLPIIGLTTTPGVVLGALLTLQFFDVLADVSMNMQGSWLSGRRSVPVVNRLHGLWSVGTVVGGMIAAVAASVVSLRVHLAGVSLLLLATLCYVTPGLLAVDQRSSAAEREEGGRSVARLAWLFALLAVFATTIEMTPTDWAAIRLVDDLGLSAGVAGLGFVATTTGMVVGRFGGDWATARFGRACLNRLAAATSAVGLAVATLAPSAPLAVAGFGAAGLGASVVFPGMYDLAARAPGRAGAVLGAMTAGIRVGVLAIPVTIGALAAGPMSVGQAMAVIAVPAAAGVVVLLARIG